MVESKRNELYECQYLYKTNTPGPQWHDKLSNSTKGKSYNSFKDDIAFKKLF